MITNRVPIAATVRPAIERASETGEFVVVRINDRGPYEGGRIIDLSRAAAAQIGMIEDGVATVRVRLVQNTLPETGPRASIDYF